MNTHKLLIGILAFILSINTNAQITFDMNLSETTSKHKLIAHSDSLNLPDSIQISGFIAQHKKGICGDVCAGGTIKFELEKKIEGYPYSYIYLITSCSTGTTSQENISLFATKYLGNEEECYYKDVVEVLDSKGIPYYKISKEDTQKLVTK